MKLTSPDYEDGGRMPTWSATARADGQNRSPSYQWSDAPVGTRSFALAVVDRSARDWVHWHVVEIPGDVTSIESGASGSGMPPQAREILTTFGTSGWGGPQPPPGSGPHSYETTLFALDVPKVDVRADADAAAFEDALEGHTLARSSIVGWMER